ncbi:PIN domain-containing protein [Neisseria leonii]|uniref:PIN domain-containing protein n=1 Tax=Neisseria leonii TaxID=2995413 RepID=UPI00237A31B0|nr:PIN domain-containing protein [Neisseria sp. 3986]MDD9325161.1 PIN domain-containing protein [Neisseria sp. 3986]
MKHLLIELTQTQAADLNKIHEQDCCVWLFVPAGRDSLPLDLAESLCRFGSRVQFIRMAHKSRDSLGFYFSFYIGRITLEDPAAQIIILSQDEGFDPLLQHIGQSGLADHTLRLNQIGGKAAAPLHQPETPPEKAAPENDPPDPLAQKHFELCLKKSIAGLAAADTRPADSDGLAKLLKKILTADARRLSKDKRKALLQDIQNRLFELGFVRDGHSDGLTYRLHAADLEARLTDAVRRCKPRNKNALFTLIRSHAEPLLQHSWSEQIAYDICRRLADAGLLNLHGQRVLYPVAPAAEAQITEIPAPSGRTAPVSDGLTPAAAKALATLRKIHRTKPRQYDKLINSLVQWLRSSEDEARAAAAELLAAGYIRQEDHGGIAYTL